MEERELNTTLGPVHIYRQAGTRQVLLLLHGAGCDSTQISWRGVMAQLAKQHNAPTVYAVDLPGYGKSSCPADMAGEAFYYRQMACLQQVTAAMGLGQFALAGTDLGGALAIAYAMAHPHQVTHLFPVGSWGLTKSLPMHSVCNWAVQNTPVVEYAFALMGASRTVARFAAERWLVQRQNLTPALLDELQQSCHSGMAGKAMTDCSRSSLSAKSCKPYFGNMLATLPMPVDFIVGEKDPYALVAESNIAALRVPDAKVHIIKGTRHLPARERPAVFCRVLCTALATRSAKQLRTGVGG